MTTFKKALYFHDPVSKKEEKEEVDNIKSLCEEKHVFLKKIDASDIPDFIERNDYEVLFFDWGGMSCGNSMMEHFCREILQLSADRPNTFFVMTSWMSREAMKDSISSFGKDRPFNLFLSVEDFAEWCNKFDEHDRVL